MAFAVSVGIIFVFPFLSSPQPEQELQTEPTPITQGDSVNNQSEQSAAEQSCSEELERQFSGHNKASVFIIQDIAWGPMFIRSQSFEMILCILANAKLLNI